VGLVAEAGVVEAQAVVATALGCPRGGRAAAAVRFVAGLVAAGRLAAVRGGGFAGVGVPKRGVLPRAGKIVQYFRANKLALHPNKTQFLLFTHSQAAKENPPEIYINSNDVGMLQDHSKLISIPNINAKSTVPAVKFLGIFIDPALNFKYHVEKMTKKLATALFFMPNAKHCLTMESMRSLYYSIFHSVIVCGIHIWSSTANTNIQGIILKQKAAVPTICGARYNNHTEPLFKTQKILPVEYLMDFFAIQFIQQYQQGFL
jgi:hypothetical protein